MEPGCLRDKRWAILADHFGTLDVSFVRDRLPALVWWAGTVLVLVLPGSAEAVGPAWLARLVGSGGDKVVHAALFFGLVALTARALHPLARQRALGWSVALAAVWAPLSEWLQRRVPHRDASLGDLVADLVGLGAAALWVLRRPARVEAR